MRPRRTLGIGAISEGTLLAEDLCAAMLDALALIGPGAEAEALAQIGEQPEHWTPEDVETLADMLGEYAPPYCYVGMHPGDGAAFGCFVDWEALEWARVEGDILPVQDPGEVPDSYETADGRLFVSDHGNATLYAWDGERYAIAWQVV